MKVFDSRLGNYAQSLREWMEENKIYVDGFMWTTFVKSTCMAMQPYMIFGNKAIVLILATQETASLLRYRISTSLVLLRDDTGVYEDQILLHVMGVSLTAVTPEEAKKVTFNAMIEQIKISMEKEGIQWTPELQL